MDVETTCRYCAVFNSEKPISKKGKIFRKCEVIKKLVTYRRTICEHFVMSDVIFCEKKGKEIKTETCLYQKRNHKNISYTYCRSCNQFVDISKCVEIDQEKKFQRVPLKKRTKKLIRRNND